MNEIEKIKYHIRLLAEALNPQENPVASLVIANDWTATDLDSAHDIFEKFDNELEKNKDVNWYEFENEFKVRFGLGYQRVKSVILAFFRNDQWIDVCHSYASKHPCIEFSEIIGDQRRRYGSALEERVANILDRNNVLYAREVQVDPRKRFVLDFLLKTSKARIAVEVKGVLDESALPVFTSLINMVRITDTADELWIVFARATPDGISKLSTQLKARVLTVDDLERALTEFI